MKQALLWTLAAYAAAASAELSRGRALSYMAIPVPGLFERQIPCQEIDPPYTCERSCGPGWVECIFPLNCYNAGAGDICCSDGSKVPSPPFSSILDPNFRS